MSTAISQEGDDGTLLCFKVAKTFSFVIPISVSVCTVISHSSLNNKHHRFHKPPGKIVGQAFREMQHAE
jgi:hypothetical protein